MHNHKNYGVYKDIKQDMRDGRLMLHDKVWVDRHEAYITSYTYRREESADLEVMTVEELLNLCKRKAIRWGGLFFPVIVCHFQYLFRYVIRYLNFFKAYRLPVLIVSTYINIFCRLFLFFLLIHLQTSFNFNVLT